MVQLYSKVLRHKKYVVVTILEEQYNFTKIEIKIKTYFSSFSHWNGNSTMPSVLRFWYLFFYACHKENAAFSEEMFFFLSILILSTQRRAWYTQLCQKLRKLSKTIHMWQKDTKPVQREPLLVHKVDIIWIRIQ